MHNLRAVPKISLSFLSSAFYLSIVVNDVVLFFFFFIRDLFPLLFVCVFVCSCNSLDCFPHRFRPGTRENSGAFEMATERVDGSKVKITKPKKWGRARKRNKKKLCCHNTSDQSAIFSPLNIYLLSVLFFILM